MKPGDEDEIDFASATKEAMDWQDKLGLTTEELLSLRPFLDFLNDAVVKAAPILLPPVGARRCFLVSAALAITLHEFEVVNRRMDEQENK